MRVQRAAPKPLGSTAKVESPPKPKPKLKRAAADRTEAPQNPGPVKLDGKAHAEAPQATSAAGVDRLYASFGVEVVEPKARPADVEAARTAFKPSDYSAKQQRWASVVAQAITELGGARMFIKRPAEDALALLTNGGRLSTIFDLKNPSDEVQAYLQGRLAHETRLGTHGVGAQAGQTVYASVEFAAHRAPELFDDTILKAAKAGAPPARPELNTGFPLTHDAVTLVMKPSVNPRSTFLPGDSYIAHAHPPRAAEHLAYVVLDNILEQGDMYFSSPKGSDVMFEQPRDQAIAAVKAYLTSGAVNRSYLEAQLRAPTLDDVAYVVIHVGAQTPQVTFDGRALDAVLTELRGRAQERGIAVVEG